MPKTPKSSNSRQPPLALPGLVRRMQVDRYLRPGHKRAVVMLSGFVENGYWYQINLSGYSLAQSLADLGFDVHVASFLPEVKAARSRTLVLDGSFAEVVTEHLPNYHHLLCERYDDIHYVGHSYGATLLSCFLLGYRTSMAAGPAQGFTADRALARAHQRKVRSLVSLAGLYGLDGGSLFRSLPRTLQAQFHFSGEELVAQILRLVDQLYKRRLSTLLPFIPTHGLGSLRYVPGVQRLIGLTQIFSPAFFPFVSMPNTHLPAFHKALAYGSSPETWENLLTILSTVAMPSSVPRLPQSRALSDLSEHLSELKLPSYFMQGDKDLVTTPAMIEKRAFARIASSHKESETLPNYGHQDLLTAKDPRLLQDKLGGWLQGF